MFLHQTTTLDLKYAALHSCILSCSYIKPQQILLYIDTAKRCILSCSYIKPQLRSIRRYIFSVVYYHVPTSNHNTCCNVHGSCLLYIIMFLHQTTTTVNTTNIRPKLYIIMFLHQTTTRRNH